MYLFFPQWQGSGPTDEVYHGARLVRDSLPATIPFVDVPVTPLHSIWLEHDIWGYPALMDQLKSACAILRDGNPATVFSVGGDCACELAPVSYLNERYAGDLAVIWFDAHADMNTPESSTSKKLHGMPLRTLLGEGDAQMIETAFTPLSPQQVFLLGAREFDPDEERYIRENHVRVFSPQLLAEQPGQVADVVANAGFNNIYIHLDVDVLDPSVFPYTAYPTPNGLTVPQLMVLLEALRSRFQVVGFSLLELVPGENPSLDGIAPLLALFASLAES